MEKDLEKLKLRITYAMWREYARKITAVTQDIEQKKTAAKIKEDFAAKEAWRELTLPLFFSEPHYRGVTLL